MNKTELRVKLEAGEKLENIFEFIDGQDCLIYKTKHFEMSDNIIYIPDVDLNEIDTESVLEGEEIANVLNHCYAGNDFVDECNGHREVAKELFDFVDWQNPNVQDLLDGYDDEEFEERYGFLMKELL